jgi:hypothetical protein
MVSSFLVGVEWGGRIAPFGDLSAVLVLRGELPGMGESGAEGLIGGKILSEGLHLALVASVAALEFGGSGSEVGAVGHVIIKSNPVAPVKDFLGFFFCAADSDKSSLWPYAQLHMKEPPPGGGGPLFVSALSGRFDLFGLLRLVRSDPLREARLERSDLLRLDCPALPLSDLHVHPVLAAEELPDRPRIGLEADGELLGRDGVAHLIHPFCLAINRSRLVDGISICDRQRPVKASTNYFLIVLPP